MHLTHEPLRLETVFEFRISVGASSAHANTLVRIEHEGITGLGEASPSHYYGENTRLVEVALETWAPHLGEDPFALEAIERRLWHVLRGHDQVRSIHFYQDVLGFTLDRVNERIALVQRARQRCSILRTPRVRP